MHYSIAKYIIRVHKLLDKRYIYTDVNKTTFVIYFSIAEDRSRIGHTFQSVQHNDNTAPGMSFVVLSVRY